MATSLDISFDNFIIDSSTDFDISFKDSNVLKVKTDKEDYNQLLSKPRINGIVLVGDKTSADLGIKEDANFVFTQRTPSKEWLIVHNLDKYPSITVVDSAETTVTGEYIYIDTNSVKCIFSSEFSGKAYLN